MDAGRRGDHFDWPILAQYRLSALARLAQPAMTFALLVVGGMAEVGMPYDVRWGLAAAPCLGLAALPAMAAKPRR